MVEKYDRTMGRLAHSMCTLYLFLSFLEAKERYHIYYVYIYNYDHT